MSYEVLNASLILLPLEGRTRDQKNLEYSFRKICNLGKVLFIQVSENIDLLKY